MRVACCLAEIFKTQEIAADWSDVIRLVVTPVRYNFFDNYQ